MTRSRASASGETTRSHLEESRHADEPPVRSPRRSPGHALVEPRADLRSASRAPSSATIVVVYTGGTALLAFGAAAEAAGTVATAGSVGILAGKGVDTAHRIERGVLHRHRLPRRCSSAPGSSLRRAPMRRTRRRAAATRIKAAEGSKIVMLGPTSAHEPPRRSDRQRLRRGHHGWDPLHPRGRRSLEAGESPSTRRTATPSRS